MKNGILKLIRAILLLIIPAITLLVPLSAISFSQTPPESDNRIRVLTTFFPIYLFTLNIARDIPAFEIDLLLPPGYGCPHDFALAPADIKKIHQADLIVINGLGMESFLEPIFQSGRRRPPVITASEPVRPITAIDNHDHHRPADSHEYLNPHPFASPHQALLMITTIADGFKKAAPQFQVKIDSNLARYRKNLEKLDSIFTASLHDLANNRIVTVHAVFDYLARDYGLLIVDIIEKEPGYQPSAHEMIEMSRRFKNPQVAALFYEPQYTDRIARVLAGEIGVKALELDPLASGPLNPPLDYYEQIMYKNLQTLMTVLK